MSFEQSNSPLAFLGPSLARREAKALLPGCDFHSPIRRGDLYRERERGRSVFLIVDGVFHQNEAVSPREVIDVIRDGAVIVGASSMGALRAAECWPAGMYGVGSIYRLYRRGVLTSDDEVMLAFDRDDENFRPLTTPLVNIRYALHRMVRTGNLRQENADSIIQAAMRLDYIDRTWPEILREAGCPELEEEIKQHLPPVDLKQMDAIRAFRYMARIISCGPQLLSRSRRTDCSFARPQEVRELPPEPLAGFDPSRLKLALARWHLVSGRAHRYLPAIAAVRPDEFALHLEFAKQPVEPLLMDSPKGPLAAAISGEARAAAARLRVALFTLWCEMIAKESLFADWLWAELLSRNELEAEIYRYRAITEAAQEAARRDLLLLPYHRESAIDELLFEHRLSSWSELVRVAKVSGYPEAEFEKYCADLAHAKCLRDELFVMG